MAGWQRRVEQVRQALADHEPVPTDQLLIPFDQDGSIARRMMPEPGVVPREAAALVLLYPQEHDLWLPLTVRSSLLPQHSGEVSLPGGAIDPDDAGATAAALRETDEELGVPPGSVSVWGVLTPIYIPPSNFRLTPVVGFVPVPVPMVPNPAEIEAVFTVPLATLLDPATVVVEDWTLRGIQMQVPFFALHGHKVWGATALVLSEFIARLRRVMG
jgi:8-oxo-dGTP pyrophosphatase MutT (NUDIX family)